MTTSAYDDYDSEDFDSEAEDFDSEADFDSEDARSDRARRRRTARRVAVDRQRRMRNRPRPSVPARRGAPTARQTVAAIRDLDLETKVGEDSLRRSIEMANGRARRATYAAVASVALDQAMDTFGDDLKERDFVRAALRAGPLLLLSPERTRPGVESYLLDPRVLGAAAIAGVVAVGVFRNRDTDVDRIDFNPPTLTTHSQKSTFAAFAVDSKGRDVNTEIKWSCGNETVLVVSEKGDYEIRGAGVARVTAQAGKRRQSFFLEVKAEPPVSPGGKGANAPTTARKRK